MPLKDESEVNHAGPYRQLLFAGAGALAGAASTIVFTWLHQVFINDIWFSIVPMLLAGVVCGVLVGWSYAVLVRKVSLLSWLGYNLIYFVMFLLLGLVSELVYEPITTVGELLASNEPPSQLFGEAMPMTVVFLLVMTVLLSVIYGRNWKHYLVVFITSTVLIMILGLNVAILGLVEVTVTSVHMLIEFFVLILALIVVYAAVFTVLMKTAFLSAKGYINVATDPLEPV